MEIAAIENWFVDSFFAGQRTERAKIELAKPTKRRSFFLKLCHSYGQYLDRMNFHSVQSFDWQAKRKTVKRDLLFEPAINQWFVMAYDERIDRTFVSSDEAKHIHDDQRMPVIFISAYRYAYFQAEFEKNLPKFLLDKAPTDYD